jgi:competence protein ComEC
MWQKYPLIRVLIPFIFGILLVDAFGSFFNPITIGVVAFLIITVTALFWFRFPHRFRFVSGALLMISIGMLSISYTAEFQKYSFQLPSKVSSDTASYLATIVDPPREKQRSVKLTCLIHEVKQEGTIFKTHEKCMIYLAKDSAAMNLCYGDELVFRTQLKEIPPPLNPSELDYRKTLQRKGIRYQSYVDGVSWKKMGEDKGNPIMSFAYRLRNKFLQIFTDYHLDSQEYGITAAIILGYDEKLDPELSAHYVGAGVTHVLSVSGMHVGVIYMILNFFLSFLDKNQHTKIAKVMILLVLIWIYSAITGLSPSVLRSAAMFSFMAIGNSLKQKVNSYHSLLASLLFLLILDPFVIYNIGLQLSYLAVFGIVWLQRPIYNLWIPKYKLTNWTWQLIAVSLAAQLVTTPISIYYFHQFPNYFILSNLLIVFISSLVIYAGVAVLATSFWFWLSNLIAYVMVWLIKAMNFITIYIDDLPGSKTTNIDLSQLSMLILYAAIFAILLALMYRNKKLVMGAFGISIAFVGLLAFDNFQEYNSNKITVYALNKQTVIDIKTSNRMISLCDSSIYNSADQTPFQVKSARISDGVQPDTTFLMSPCALWNKLGIALHGQFLKAGNKRIAFINKQPMADNQPISVDYAIVFGNPKLKMAQAIQGIHAKIWAFDGSNSQYKVKKWVKECDSLKVNNFPISSQGALILDF